MNDRFPATSLGLRGPAHRRRVAAYRGAEPLGAGGYSAEVIEYDLDVIAETDWVIDLWPESCTTGGRAVCAGPPEQRVARA